MIHAYSLYFSVICYPVPEGKSGQQAVEFLQKRIETLGAEKTGTFFVDCETYQNVQSKERGHWFTGFKI